MGGWSSVESALPATHFQVLGDYTLSRAIGLALPTMLLLIGNQGMYQKFFSAKSESDARKSVVGWIVGTVVLETLLMAVAVIASAKLHTEVRERFSHSPLKKRCPPG